MYLDESSDYCPVERYKNFHRALISIVLAREVECVHSKVK